MRGNKMGGSRKTASKVPASATYTPSAEKIPRSATFQPGKRTIPAGHTHSGRSKSHSG